MVPWLSWLIEYDFGIPHQYPSPRKESILFVPHVYGWELFHFLYGWDLELIFFESAWYIRISPRFLLQTIELIETNLLELQSMLDFPVCLLYPYDPMISLDPPWDPVHHEEQEQPLDFVAQSYGTPTAWVLHLVPRLLSSCNAAVEKFQCCASWLRFGRHNGCRDTYTTPKQIGLPIQWPLFIWIDSYPSKTVTCENFMLTVPSFHTTMVKTRFLVNQGTQRAIVSSSQTATNDQPPI